MKIRFHKENIMDIQAEIEPLFVMHRDEGTAFDLTKYPPDTDWKMYKKLCDLGLYRLYTARTPKGTLVGYVGFTINTFMRGASYTIAMNDMTFLHKIARGKGVGYKMIAFAVEDVEQEVDCVSLSMKMGTPHELMIKRLGFRSGDMVYYKEM